MDEHGLPIVGTGVDYRKVPSLEHRNTLAMINKFVIHTTKFLNQFASVCEERLLDLSLRIQRLDVSLNILEAKLNSIEGLEGIQASTQYDPPSILSSAGNAPPTQPTTTATTQPAAAGGSSSASASGAPPPPPSGEPIPPPQPVPGEGDGGGMKIKDHPDFQKFFKMKRLGVNPLQITMEMKKVGLNPDLLEDEDAPAPMTGRSAGGPPKGGNSDDSSMSGSSDESTSEEEDSDSFGSD